VTRLLLVVLVIAIIIGVPVERRVRRICRDAPGARSWFAGAATVLLIAVGIAVPHLDDVIPDRMRESPAGLLPFVGAGLVLCIVAGAAVGAIVGAVRSGQVDAGDLDI
jgi:peptidoglycan/LPS O-acetylase OafA/YrhL